MSFFSFILYPRLQRLAKDLLKQLQVQDSGSWASNKVSALDRTLGEVARILEKEVCNSSLASGHNLCFFLTDFPGGSGGKASAYNVGDPGSIPGSGRSPGEGNGNPLQYSCLENPMDRGAW